MYFLALFKKKEGRIRRGDVPIQIKRPYINDNDSFEQWDRINQGNMSEFRWTARRYCANVSDIYQLYVIRTGILE